MIYEYVVERLNDAEGLKGKLYPVGVCIDDIYTVDNAFSFAVYTFKSRTPVKDMAGEIHHYAEEVTIDFVGRLYDKIHELYCETEAAFGVGGIETDSGEYVFSVNCSSPEPDTFDPDYGLLRRTMLVTIDWCPC